jgi:hypothetical protein
MVGLAPTRAPFDCGEARAVGAIHRRVDAAAVVELKARPKTLPGSFGRSPGSRPVAGSQTFTSPKALARCGRGAPWDGRAGSA